jgi:hypothetical protein
MAQFFIDRCIFNCCLPQSLGSGAMMRLRAGTAQKNFAGYLGTMRRVRKDEQGVQQRSLFYGFIRPRRAMHFEANTPHSRGFPVIDRH